MKADRLRKRVGEPHYHRLACPQHPIGDRNKQVDSHQRKLLQANFVYLEYESVKYCSKTRTGNSKESQELFGTRS